MLQLNNLDRVMKSKDHLRNRIISKRIKIVLFLVMMFCSNYVYSQSEYGYYSIIGRWNSLAEASAQAIKDPANSVKIISLKNEAGYYCFVGSAYPAKMQTEWAYEQFYKKRYPNAYIRQLKRNDITFHSITQTQSAQPSIGVSNSQTQTQTNSVNVSGDNNTVIIQNNNSQ